MKKMVYGGIGAAIALVIILMLRSAAFDATWSLNKMLENTSR